MIDTAVRYNVLRKCLQFLYPVAIALPKLAILFLYHRLFCRMLCRRTTQVTGVIIILTWLTSFLLAAFICHPFDYEWNFAVEDVPGSGCGDVDLAQVVISFPNILTDILILIIPIRSLWRLQVPTAKKVGLLLTFGSGCLYVRSFHAIVVFGVYNRLTIETGSGTITGIIRVVAFFIYEKEADESDAYSTFLSNGLITWTIVEPSVYLIAATLPFMRPLLRRISDKGHLSDRLTTSTRYYRSWRPRGSNTGSDGNLHLKPKNAAACPVAPLPIDLEKSLPSVPSATASSDSERASMACTHSSHTFTPSGKGDDTKSYSCPLCT